ncbi:hypothetical protein [Herbaspirillum sp. RV1423]|uniref:hypothetical protein n=1 Tax=Herbaspirillum sp. RV1423 TaxID=1443993 RepID=UPI0005595745|nr:hypothetical protein [Herbaspirillum sp. RV1423]
MTNLRSWQSATLAVAFVLPVTVFAQTSQKSNDPLDPAAVVPATTYDSAFSGYQSFQEAKLIPWRQSNDTVRQAGDGEATHNMDSMKAEMPTSGKDKSMAPAPAHDMSSMGSRKAKE